MRYIFLTFILIIYKFFSVKKIFIIKLFFHIKTFFSANNVYFVKNTNIFSKIIFFVVLQHLLENMAVSVPDLACELYDIVPSFHLKVTFMRFAFIIAICNMYKKSRQSVWYKTDVESSVVTVTSLLNKCPH